MPPNAPSVVSENHGSRVGRVGTQLTQRSTCVTATRIREPTIRRTASRRLPPGVEIQQIARTFLYESGVLVSVGAATKCPDCHRIYTRSVYGVSMRYTAFRREQTVLPVRRTAIENRNESLAREVAHGLLNASA